MTTIIRNLTPHPVNIVLANGETITYPVDGPAPRVVMGKQESGKITDQFGNEIEDSVTWASPDVTDLPEPEEGVIMIVSRMTADAVGGRPDLRCPEGIVRDEAGRIVGCRSLTRPVLKPPTE